MKNSKSFEEKYNYFFFRVKKAGFFEKAQIPCAWKNNDTLILNFFNLKVICSPDGIRDNEGQSLTDTVKNVLCQYLLMCPDSLCESSNRLVTLREFSNSGPLFSAHKMQRSVSGIIVNLANGFGSLHSPDKPSGNCFKYPVFVFIRYCQNGACLIRTGNVSAEFPGNSHNFFNQFDIGCRGTVGHV